MLQPGQSDMHPNADQLPGFKVAYFLEPQDSGKPRALASSQVSANLSKHFLLLYNILNCWHLNSFPKLYLKDPLILSRIYSSVSLGVVFNKRMASFIWDCTTLGIQKSLVVTLLMQVNFWRCSHRTMCYQSLLQEHTLERSLKMTTFGHLTFPKWASCLFEAGASWSKRNASQLLCYIHFSLQRSPAQEKFKAFYKI